MKTTVLFLFSIALFLASAVFAFLPRRPTEEIPVSGRGFQGGYQDFEATDLAGRTMSTALLRRDKALLLAFTDTSCPFGKQQMEILDRLAREEAARAATAVVFLHAAEDDVRAVADGKAFASLLDPEGMIGRRYGVAMVPVVMIVDAQGVLAYRNTGLVPFETLKQELDKSARSARDG